MPAADKKPTGKKKTALAKSAPPASATPAVPAGPDPIVVLSYQLECKTAEAKSLQNDRDRLQAEVRGLQTQLEEQRGWHEAMLRDITRQHKSQSRTLK